MTSITISVVDQGYIVTVREPSRTYAFESAASLLQWLDTNLKAERGGVVDEVVRNYDVELALEFARKGGHHKTWVVDQMVRALTGDGYTKFVREAKDGENGPDTYEWDEGVAP